MAKRKAKEKSSLKPDDFLEPIDITKFGTDDDPCFGKHPNLAEPECKRCGDSALCGIVFGQNLNVKRAEIESNNRFKDLEKPDEEDKPINKSLMNWVKDKLDEGLSRSEIIKKAKNTFGSTRDEIKDIIKKLK